MYEFLKGLSKFLFTDNFLKTYEDRLRNGISYFYRGQRHQCNICGFQLRRFIPVLMDDLLCPKCGSLSRTRCLYSQLVSNSEINGRILHFSPSRGLYSTFKSLETISYYATDFENEFVADYRMDITDLNIKTSYIDLIICLHVLEHVEEDIKAISELYRVLKPNGICYLQTPYKDGAIFEDPRIISPKDRTRAFGQKDHVRVYSLDGLEKRLNDKGFRTEIISFKEDQYYGLKNELMIKAIKA